MKFVSTLTLSSLLAGTLVGTTPAGDRQAARAPARAAVTDDAADLGGTVVDAATHRPISRAIVEIAGTGLDAPRFVVTDTSGAFELEGLSPGRFSLTAARPGYMAGYYGSARSGHGPAEPIMLAPRQHRADLVVALQRGGVIAGRITGVTGGGQPDVMVSLLRSGRAGAPPIVVSRTQTDDQGDYRFFGLVDGRYFVAALPGFPLNLDGARLMASPAEGTVGFAPIVYPSGTSIDSADAIALGAGETRESIDMQMRFVRTARLSGAVTPSGAWAGPLELRLSSSKQTFGFTGYNAWSPIPVLADGRFSRTSLGPGHYQLLLRGKAAAGDAPNAAGQVLWAEADVDLNGADVDGVDLHVRPALTIHGRLEIAGEHGSSLPGLQVTLTSAAAGRSSSPVEARVDASGAFDLTGVIPGAYRLGLSDSAAGARWVVESGAYGATALTDAMTIADAPESLTLTAARAGGIRGQLLEVDGSPAHAYSIVLIDGAPGSASPTTIVRLATDGSFAFEGLRAGRYWVGAVTGADDEDLADEAFVDAVRKTATVVDVARGELKTIAIRVGGRSDRF